MTVRRVVTPPQLLRRFRREKRGVATIELAFVILPFLMLILGTLEISLIHLMRSSFSNAVNETSRPIYTGGGGCTTVDDIRTSICGEIAVFSNASCIANTKIVLEELADFGAGTSFDSFDDITESVSVGSSESVMMMQVFYRWETLFPMLGSALGGDDNELILSETNLFRNEPYGDGGGCV